MSRILALYIYLYVLFRIDLLRLLLDNATFLFNSFISVKSYIFTFKPYNKSYNIRIKITIFISFTNDYLKKFLEDGTMTKEDLYAFFEGDEVREKYKTIEQEIKALSY